MQKYCLREVYGKGMIFRISFFFFSGPKLGSFPERVRTGDTFSYPDRGAIRSCSWTSEKKVISGEFEGERKHMS